MNEVKTKVIFIFDWVFCFLIRLIVYMYCFFHDHIDHEKWKNWFLYIMHVLGVSEGNNKSCKEKDALFRRLHLQNSQEQKLTADLLRVGLPVQLGTSVQEKDLVKSFVQRLMTLDYRARYVAVQHKRSDAANSHPVEDSEPDGTFCSESDDADQSGQSKKAHIHPMDVQMAAFLCSDNNLKQSIVTKLSQCQYAFPLLFPDPVTADIVCPLWTFRQTNKTWKKTELKDNLKTITTKSGPICKAETSLVSFLRLGSMSVSKSELMNTLISERHNTFFHRNCPGNTKTRHLLDGVAEIAWYCPAGKPDDSFLDCVAFCNLHGDSLLVEKQREILTKISSVIVLLVPTFEMNMVTDTVISTILGLPSPLIVLMEDTDSDAAQLKPQKFTLGLKDKSQSNVSAVLKTIIRQILSEKVTPFQLGSMSEVSGVKVDEGGKICENGKSAAMTTITLIQNMDVSTIKDRFLPCQGETWHEWCKINKEMYTLKDHIEQEKSQKSKELKRLRKKQCATSGSELISSFTDKLMHFSEEDRNYFLKWTQIFTDGLSSEQLSSLQHSYDQKRAEVLALKKKGDKSGQLNAKQSELKKLLKEIQAANFGLEHIFREMAQIYEAHHFLKQQKCEHTEWVKYPELAADLMIAGHPMELMDGDAGHVPLTWISSLLHEVIKKLGDQRVFVLSVLGVQSSGKSTMLNAMFGLRFAVSAGRCTKGAYMQLLQLSEEIRKDYKFDYVLVVDTEGLRALETEGSNTLQRDNELATFVVGLANMTLINIFGEDPAEMQDILQIVIQSIMRMKKVKFSPSCVFVHQNMTDIASAEKIRDRKKLLQEKLDEITQLAAKAESYNAKCFSDVIEFDVQEDVKYIAQLWEGNPPMAPPNPEYSESIQELKSTILSKASETNGTKFSHLSSKIQDLWTALLNEHFVFSFKNTQEIAAYRRLEAQYGNWTWVLKSEMLTIEKQFLSKIKNGQLNKINYSDLYRTMSKTFEHVKKEKRLFFENDSDKDMLAKWHRDFENKIQEFHEELLKGVKKNLEEVIGQRKASSTLEVKKIEFEDNLLHQSKALAHKIKDDIKDLAGRLAEFENVWNRWAQELTSDTKSVENINLEEDHVIVLEELGIEPSLIEESKSSEKYKCLPETGDYILYVNAREQKAKESLSANSGSNSLTSEEQQRIRAFISNVEKQSLENIKEKPVASTGYSSTYLQDMAQHIQQQLTSFELQIRLNFLKNFAVDLSLYVFDKAGGWFLESHKTYIDTFLEDFVKRKKEEYHKVFESLCQGNSSAEVFGQIICEKLKVSAVEAAQNQSAISIAKEIRSNISAFNGNRLNLEKYVLTHLAEKEDFEKFITYIKNPRKQVEELIKEEVGQYMTGKNKDNVLKIFQRNVQHITNLIGRALNDATRKVKTKKGTINNWVEHFSSDLSDEMTLEKISCQNFTDIKDFDFLKREIEKGLKAVTEEITTLSLDKVKGEQKIDEILIKQLCNCCWERCPFCAAVCNNTLNNHGPDKHSVPFHRPSGIEGWHTVGTINLVVDFCTTLVASDRNFIPDVWKSTPYKQYPTAGGKYETWSITANASMLPYWKWFVCHFQKELESHYKKKFQGQGEIPSEWRNYSKKDAIQSLHEMYN